MTRRERIYSLLFVTPKLIVGGAQVQLLTLLRGLNKQRFRIIVAPMYSGGELEADFRAIPGVEIVHLGRRNKWDFWTLARVARLLLERRIDAVTPFVSPAAVFALLPALLVGTPVLVATERSGSRRIYRGGGKVYLTAEDWLAKQADVVIANSEAGRRLLLSAGVAAERTLVVHNGLNPRRLETDSRRIAACRTRLGVPANGHVVGILATLTPAKGHDVFIRAAALIHARRPETRFAIIGDGPLRSELEAQVRESGLADDVVFFGHQPRVADHLAACDVLVSSSWDLEGHSNSILEAMALGVPVVATDVGGNPELVQDGVTGCLVGVRDHVGIATKIEALLSDPSAAGTLAEQARAMVTSRFSQAQMVAQYEAVYTSLIEDPSRRRRRLWTYARGVL